MENPETESGCKTPTGFLKLYETSENDASGTDEKMSARLSFEQLEVGQNWTSDCRTITETDVINFANITGDLNPLHLSREFASRTHYRQPVAHGLLGMSWVAGLGSRSPAVDTVAFIAVRDWEFLKPLFFGDTVHVVTEVLEKQANGRRTGRVKWQQKLINQRGEITQQGVFETLVRLNPVSRPHFETAQDSETSESIAKKSNSSF